MESKKQFTLAFLPNTFVGKGVQLYQSLNIERVF